MSSAPPLPSAEFLALVPDDPRLLTVQRVEEVGVMISSGRWAFDSNEIDPRTQLNIVHSLAQSVLMDEQAQSRALELVVSLGADVNFVASDGRSPWQWASDHGYRDLQKELERLGAAIPSGHLDASRKQILETLEDLESSWMSADKIVEGILSPEGFGSLEETVNGIPLGLYAAWKKLSINGAALAGTSGDSTHIRRTDRLMESLGRLGKEALGRAPGSDFPLWCWLAQCQTVRWSPTDASKTRRSRWVSQWVGLEKAIIRSRYPRRPPTQAQRQLALDATDMTQRVMKSISDAGTVLKKRKLQPVAAYLLMGLRQWADRVSDLPEGEAGQDITCARKEALWGAAAALAKEVPKNRWHEGDFSSSWASAAYYSLRPDLRSALRSGLPLPEFVAQPWLTVPALMMSPKDERPEDLERLLGWLEENKPSSTDRELGLSMLSHHPSLVSELSARVLDASLASTPSPFSPRVRF